MSAATVAADLEVRLGGLDTPLGPTDYPGPTDERSVTAAFGFWIFLLSDAIIFGALFATYAVLRDATAGGITIARLADFKTVAIETGCLLTSSFACGIGMIAADRQRAGLVYAALGLTFVLGLAFLGLELNEFAHLIGEHKGPDRSAFLSAFFALVGTHGLHVTMGLLWLGGLLFRLWRMGFTPGTQRGFLLFGLFWHLIDIVWVGVFSVVYLMGASK